LFKHADSSEVSGAVLRREMFKKLGEVRPDVVAVNGWSDKGALAALSWCLKQKKPAILMSESTKRDARRNLFKEKIKRDIVACFSAALVGGKPQKDYVVKLGMTEDQVFTGYDAIDNEYFELTSEKIRAQADWYRNEYNLPETYFLSSNRFIPKKNLFRLLEAYALYRQNTESPWSLVILGDGSLRVEIEKRVLDLGLFGNVVLPGFKQYHELPAYYALASCYLQASTSEQWGLVVNEAMASRLPVLVSRMCGCQEDLVQEGRNGFTFDPYNPEDICEKMVDTTGSYSKLKTMGKESRNTISNWGCDNFGRNLLAAAEKAIQGPLPRKNTLTSLLLKSLILK